MISEIMVRKRNKEEILGKYQINYITEFDLYTDIVLIVHMFCAKILFLRLIREDSKEQEA